MASVHEAILSNDGAYTVFCFDGYLVVLAKYSHNAEPEEEYIDLKPVLIDKGIDPVTFLEPIKTVRIA